MTQISFFPALHLSDSKKVKKGMNNKAIKMIDNLFYFVLFCNSKADHACRSAEALFVFNYCGSC